RGSGPSRRAARARRTYLAPDGTGHRGGAVDRGASPHVVASRPKLADLEEAGALRMVADRLPGETTAVVVIDHETRLGTDPDGAVVADRLDDRLVAVVSPATIHETKSSTDQFGVNQSSVAGADPFL